MTPYSAADLAVRRAALGLTTRALADLVGRAQGNISDVEQGRRPVTDELMQRVLVVERWAAEHLRRQLDEARARACGTSTVTLHRLTDGQFREEFPDAATAFAPMPVSLHDAVLGRVAADLTLAGCTVRVTPATDPVAPRPQEG